MAKIVRSGQSGALDHIDSSQATFRSQIAALTDAVRQLGGNAQLGAGATVNDPLNAPYVLYVNPSTGDDTFAGGEYSSGGTADDRISLQRLECGYTQARPFKTINRAVIEAGIITAKSYYTSPLTGNDLVSIVLMPGVYTIYNAPGKPAVAEWPISKNPTDAELTEFNSQTTGGVLLPRGVSLCGLDLRKTIFRPDSVPAVNDEASDASNRRAIFKVTGTGYYFGFTFMDKVGSKASHHLLHAFEFASKAELDEFYGKIASAFGGPANTGGLDPALVVARTSEYEIVGPRPASGGQDAGTDTTLSASPYIFNCSLRSNYGMCGVYADGAKTSGFRSMVIAQFTGVSLQRDLSCWQKYNAGAWVPVAGYSDYINTDPDNVQMAPTRRSFHIRAVNNAIIQEVSVFAIGQGIHHWVQTGGEITITNSNSNFGGCAALAQGYKTAAFASDRSWNVGTLRVATDLSEKQNNVRKVYLGTIDAGVANGTTSIKLTQALIESAVTPGVPAMLERDGYSLKGNSYLWVENPRGKDYRAILTGTAWQAATPDTIRVASAFRNQDGIKPGDTIVNSQGYDTGQTWPDLAGARVYIRRLQDTRSVDERKYTIRCNNTSSAARTPVRDYVLQTTAPGSGSITSAIRDTALLTVAAAASVTPANTGVLRSASVELRRNNPTRDWQAGALYRPGDCVSYQGKKYSCKTQNQDASFVSGKWDQSYVHMEVGYHPEDYWKNAQPVVVFDDDIDANDNTTNCGYGLSLVWSTDTAIQRQYRSGSDYLGLHSFLMSIGFTADDAHTLLLPKLSSTRERNPNAALDGISAPAGAANGWNNWPVEFRRPSNIRLFGHAWEWAGYLNYTKALPEYQRELSALNKFTYYFTNQNGGRVYGSGFNEEGFTVTPQGLQDIATGTEVSFEQIGEANVSIDDIEFPTFYESLSVNKLSINNELSLSGVVKGSPTWEGGYGTVLPSLPVASTTQRGIIELATAAEVQEFLRDDLAVTPATLIQALGDAIKSVANMRMSLSAASAVPSGNQLNATSIFIHPNNGNEIALYSTASLRWQVVRFTGVQTFSLSPCTVADKNYDIYLYNSGTATAPVLAVEFVAWASDTTPPTRGNQDGVVVRDRKPSRRLVGVVRTTTPGVSTISLGSTIAGSDSANYPRIYLANMFNLYDCRAIYFFGSAWNVQTLVWAPPPATVYPTAPRISWVQTGETLVTAFLDIYHNPGVVGAPSSNSYVAPGIDDNANPPADAFYGEAQADNTTAGSQWARALPAGKHDIFYLYKQFNGASKINEHPAHGMIVTIKV